MGAPGSVAHGSSDSRGAAARPHPHSKIQSTETIQRETLMRSATLLLTTLLAAGSAQAGGKGMVQLTSPHDVTTTTERLVDTLESKGMTIFAVVDHADEWDEL